MDRASKYVGIWRRKSGRFSAAITVRGIRTGIGTFDTQEEAARAYDNVAAELDSGATLNFPLEHKAPLSRRFRRKDNRIEINGQVANIYLTNSQAIAIVDAAALDMFLSVESRNGFVWTARIVDVAWREHVSRRTSYAESMWRGCHLALHRLVIQAKASDIVDHRNGDGLDCRLNNLRLTDASGNSRNSRAPKTSPNRFKGITKDPRNGRWRAQIKTGGKNIWLGSFQSEIEAATAYDRAATEIFGEFAKLNFRQGAVQ